MIFPEEAFGFGTGQWRGGGCQLPNYYQSLAISGLSPDEQWEIFAFSRQTVNYS